ncbi:hypothetical protein B296_00053730 [Ensete ventricosum]|uniref:Uncharacterized protein n=1 Tax=Ensete ventricosum TaxID=4639 RepID=A0A426XBN7_ENSVE|nr:hypothetical protein B296_00053730 [Ensete ventricosum]
MSPSDFTSSSSKDLKTSLKLKFKNPCFEQKSSWAPHGEEENTVKGQRSKRKRPSTEKMGVLRLNGDGPVRPPSHDFPSGDAKARQREGGPYPCEAKDAPTATASLNRRSNLPPPSPIAQSPTAYICGLKGIVELICYAALEGMCPCGEGLEARMGGGGESREGRRHDPYWG